VTRNREKIDLWEKVLGTFVENIKIQLEKWLWRGRMIWAMNTNEISRPMKAVFVFDVLFQGSSAERSCFV
jgi:hypothetical protein